MRATGAVILLLLPFAHASWSLISGDASESAPRSNPVAEKGAGIGGFWGGGAPPQPQEAKQEFWSILDISSGEDHTCVVIGRGEEGKRSVKCWGSGFYGQLGSGSSSNVGDDPDETSKSFNDVDLGNANPVKVKAGAAHTCVLLDDGNIKCWGWGVCGQTGYGHVSTTGDDSNEMGTNLHNVHLNGLKAVDLALGETHTCALLEDDTVRCWGCNSNSQLGIQHPSPRDTEPYPIHTHLLPIPFSSRAVGVVAGSTYTCARLENGHVECVGNFGSFTTHKNVAVNPKNVSLPQGQSAEGLVGGKFFACAILSNQDLYCFGQSFSREFDNKSMKLQHPNEIASHRIPLSGRVKNAAAGDFHVCVSTGNVTHECWGWNAFQQLGFTSSESTVPVDSSVKRRFLPGLKVSQFALGSAHTCAVVGSRKVTVRCVGMGLAGQRGDGMRHMQANSVTSSGDKNPSVIRFPLEESSMLREVELEEDEIIQILPTAAHPNNHPIPRSNVNTEGNTNAKPDAKPSYIGDRSTAWFRENQVEHKNETSKTCEEKDSQPQAIRGNVGWDMQTQQGLS
ncbi:hypothetical protein AAMO2058_001025200 [Amorphochlora amoebiformis]